MVELRKLEKSDREQFIKDNQEAFNYGAMEVFANITKYDLLSCVPEGVEA